MNRRRDESGVVSPDLVAAILAGGVIVVLAILASTALADSVTTGPGHAPSENLTQILATVLGGLVGALGAYLGTARVGSRARHRARAPREAPAEPVVEPVLGPNGRPMVVVDPEPVPVRQPVPRQPVPRHASTPPYGTPPTGSPAAAVERTDRGEPVGP